MRDPILLAATLGALLLAAAPLPAQAPGAAAAGAAARSAADRAHRVPVEEAATTPFVPADHWSREALRRLAAAGLVEPGAALASWPLRRGRVRALLERAAERGGEDDLPTGRYLDHFDDDFPDATSDGRLTWRAHAGSGGSARHGAMRAGAMYWVDGVGWAYPGPRPLPDRAAPMLDGALDVALRPALAASARVHRTGGGTVVDAAHAAVSGPGFDLWAGRRDLSFGAAPRGGLVLSEGTAFDGVGAAVPGGVRLPGFLDALGPVRGTALLARMERSGAYEHPWFWAARATVSPRPSLVIGLNRAALFGGAGNQPVTARRVLLMAAGFTDVSGKGSGFENQVASVDFFWQTAALGTPLALYGEWAFDDISLAFVEVPGLLIGAELPAVPGLPRLALGLEHVWFDRSCCGYPPWYRHGTLAEGWTDRGAPLGHPLGGHGRQSSITWQLDAPGELLLTGGRFFVRRRGVENLFAPDRTGSSAGADVRLVVWTRGPFRGRASGAVERGADWHRWSVTAALELVF